MIKQVNPEIIEVSRQFQLLCTHPFYAHPRGCPNYGRRHDCPPNALLLDQVLDFNRDVYLIFTEFNVGGFAEHIRRSHPEWRSTRQWYNPRYWQPRARKFQRQEEEHALRELGFEAIIRNPEGLGVNVSRLMSSIGIYLSWHWPPTHKLENYAFLKNKVYLVSIGGFLK